MPESSALLAGLRENLAALDAAALRRVRRSNALPCGPHARVDGRDLLAFCSNDYLGLAADAELAAALAEGAARWGAGGGASHLVSGHYLVHDELEAALADFVGCERALYLSTGYLANLGVAAALVGRGDAVFADRLNHASLVDAVLLSRARLHRYPHLDFAALSRQLQASSAARKLIISDTVFSMDGDVAPLAELFELACQHDAWLLLDDAHGVGVLGPQGRGALAATGLNRHPHAWRIIQMGTLGKAAGISGAFLAGQAEVIEWLLQRARTYVFTTGAPPAIAHALLVSLRRIASADGDARRARLGEHIRTLRAALPLRHWRLLPSTTPIQPLLIGDNAETIALATALLAEGLWVPAIRPPTVPAASARLRISLSAAHSEAEIRRLGAALLRLEAQFHP